MSQFTLLYGARQLLTLRGPSSARRGSALRDLGLIENGSVLIEKGVIFAVGPTRRIENLKQAREALEIDVSGSIIMPGLIDPHFHVTSSELLGGSNRRQIKTGRLFEDGLALMRSCLQHGTLAVVLKISAEANDFRGDASLLRVWARIGTSNVGVVRAWHIDQPPQSEAELESFSSVLRNLARGKLIDAVSLSRRAPCEPAEDAWASQILDLGLPIHVQWNGGAAADLALLLRQIGPATVCCRPTLSDGEVVLLAESKAVNVFAPGTEIQATGSALRELVDAGGAVALSSGYHPIAAPGFSMQMALSLAVIQGQLTPEEAISAATVNAAYAAGLGDVTGTLETGKRANVLVMSVPDYRDIVRQFGINHVGTVVRDGNVVLNRPLWKMAAHE